METQNSLSDVKPTGEFVPPVPKFWSLRAARFRICLLLSFGVFVNAAIRMNLSMAMVCMVNGTAVAFIYSNDSLKILNHTYACTMDEADAKVYEGSLIWSSKEQAFVFTGIFWGGTITTLLSGWLADRYGPKNIFLAGTSVGLIGTFLTPLTAIRGGAVGLFVLRFVIGLGWGVMYPCTGAIIAKWCHPNEKSSAIAIYTGGTQISSITGMPLFAWLCSRRQFLGGWPLIFYVSAILPLLWVLLWWIFVTNSPAKNRFISVAELEYIENSLQTGKTTLGIRKKATNRTPWKQMALSGPVSSVILAYFAASVLSGTMQVYMPTYFKDVLKLNLRINGFYTALPFVCQWLSKFIASPISDRLKRTQMGHSKICKIFNSIGCFGCASFLVGLSFVSCQHPVLALSFLNFIFVCFGCFIPGFRTAMLSIAPVYNGTITSVSKFASDMAQVIGPFFVGAVTTQGTRQEWQIVFLSIAVCLTLAGIIFLIFGSSEVQSWAVIEDDLKDDHVMHSSWPISANSQEEKY